MDLSSYLKPVLLKEQLRQGPDVELISIARPAVHNLYQVLRASIVSCYSRCPNAKAVAGEISWYV